MNKVPKKIKVSSETSYWLKQEAKRTGQSEDSIINKAIEQYKVKYESQ